MQERSVALRWQKIKGICYKRVVHFSMSNEPPYNLLLIMVIYYIYFTNEPPSAILDRGGWL